MDRPTLLTPSIFNTEQFANVVGMTERYMDDLEQKDVYIDEDFEHYLFEEVMLALYGKDVFKWINERT